MGELLVQFEDAREIVDTALHGVSVSVVGARWAWATVAWPVLDSGTRKVLGSK
jgi:hypothetical protein